MGQEDDSSTVSTRPREMIAHVHNSKRKTVIKGGREHEERSAKRQRRALRDPQTHQSGSSCVTVPVADEETSDNARLPPPWNGPGWQRRARRAHSAARSRRGAQGVRGQGMCSPASYRAESRAVAQGEGS